MLPRVVADSNILISAFYRGGKAQRVLELAEAGALDLYLSQFILDEVAGVLSLKFNWDAQSILEALGTLQYTPVDPGPLRLRIVRDTPDNRILECAVAARAKYLVTGDAQLLALTRFHSTTIITLRNLLSFFEK
jgi:putative PIN family toxin of toxin-antitoxin system